MRRGDCAGSLYQSLGAGPIFVAGRGFSIAVAVVAVAVAISIATALTAAPASTAALAALASTLASGNRHDREPEDCGFDCDCRAALQPDRSDHAASGIDAGDAVDHRQRLGAPSHDRLPLTRPRSKVRSLRNPARFLSRRTCTISTSPAVRPPSGCAVDLRARSFDAECARGASSRPSKPGAECASGASSRPGQTI